MWFRKYSSRNRQHTKNKKQRGFVAPRQVEDYWNYHNHDIYIEKPNRRLPGWLLPLIALFLIIALLFWVMPTIIGRIQIFDQQRQDNSEAPVTLIYDTDVWVVGKPVADVFATADIKAARTSQVLYNEPVTVLPDESAYGFAKVRLTDDTEGYMLLTDLIDSRESIEPGYYQYKLVVNALNKRIMSHASRGTLVVEIMLGTVLFADYHGDGIYRVRLPEGGIGWISDEGVIVLEPDGDIALIEDGARYFASTALMFNQITVLENGQSIMGISVTGIARLAAFVNGIYLPRDLQRISHSGEPVYLQQDQDTGRVDLAMLKIGDLLLLNDGKDEEPAELAIYVDSGQILYARAQHTSIRIYDLNRNEDIWQRVIGARRLFP